jgi:hypothetical protein
MVDLTLSTLTVVKRADLVGRDEPLLWTMFIVLSAETINSRQFVVKTDPVKGRLAKAGKGDTVAIPASIGRFHSDATIGMVGVVTVAFDDDLRTNAQITAGYAAGATALNQAIIDHFPVYGFADVGAAEKAEIQAKVRDAVKAAFLDQGVFIAVFGGKPLGGDSFTSALTGGSLNVNHTLTMKAKNDRAIYTVAAKLQFQK